MGRAQRRGVRAHRCYSSVGVVRRLGDRTGRIDGEDLLARFVIDASRDVAVGVGDGDQPVVGVIGVARGEPQPAGIDDLLAQALEVVVHVPGGACRPGTSADRDSQRLAGAVVRVRGGEVELAGAGILDLGEHAAIGIVSVGGDRPGRISHAQLAAFAVVGVRRPQCQSIRVDRA